MPTLTREIRKESKLHDKICREVKRRVRMSESEFVEAREKWSSAENEVLAYLPEKAVDRERKNRRNDGGSPEYTTMKVPYSYAVLMAMHTYLTSVFLGRNPIFQYEGRHGEAQNKVDGLESVMSYQLGVGRMIPNFYSWLYDGGRYGVGITGLYWEDEVHYFSEIEEEMDVDPATQEEIATGRMVTTTSRVRGYSGNKTYNIRPHDFLPDPRVAMRDFQKGEFVGVKRRVSWASIIKRSKSGFYTNVEDIDRRIAPDFRESSTYNNNNDSALHLPAGQEDGVVFETSQDDRKRPDVVPVYEMYIEILPDEWNISKSDYPEIWVFSVTGDCRTVIGAQPLGARHGKFPFALVELEPDAYALFNRGVPEIMDPVSRTVDWLLNSHFYNVRAVLNNQFVVDPSRVVMKDVLDPLPGGAIRVKPQAYGIDDVSKLLKQLPVQDVTQTHLVDIQNMLKFGERVSGVNDAILGTAATSSRRSATEVRSSNTFGINRLKTITEYMSATGWSDLSMMMVQNTQQMMDAEMQLRVVGQNAGNNPNPIMVNPELITGFYDFVTVDGTMPIDRIAQATLWKDILTQLRSVPGAFEQVDFFKIMAHIAQLVGIRNFDSFKVQVIPDGVQPPGTVPVSLPNGQGGSQGGSQSNGQLGPVSAQSEAM